MTVRRSMETLSDAEAWAHARRGDIGRLAVIVDDHPEIFPVNYLVDRGSILLRTSAGTKLAASVGQAVAFEVDGFEATAGDAWSVMIKGVAHELTGLYEVLDAMEAAAPHLAPLAEESHPPHRAHRGHRAALPAYWHLGFTSRAPRSHGDRASVLTLG